MNSKKYMVSFRCFFDRGGEANYSTHYQPLRLCDIERWIVSYRFTHPACTSISFKIWFEDSAKAKED